MVHYQIPETQIEAWCWNGLGVIITNYLFFSWQNTKWYMPRSQNHFKKILHKNDNEGVTLSLSEILDWSFYSDQLCFHCLKHLIHMMLHQLALRSSSDKIYLRYLFLIFYTRDLSVPGSSFQDSGQRKTRDQAPAEFDLTMKLRNAVMYRLLLRHKWCAGYSSCRMQAFPRIERERVSFTGRSLVHPNSSVRKSKCLKHTYICSQFDKRLCFKYDWDFNLLHLQTTILCSFQCCIVSFLLSVLLEFPFIKLQCSPLI